MEHKLPRKKTTIRDLFPNVTDHQLKEIEETLHHYAAIAGRVSFPQLSAQIVPDG